MTSGSLGRAGALALGLVGVACAEDVPASSTSTSTGAEPRCPLPVGNRHVVAIEGAARLHMALWSDGRLQCWGDDDFDLCARGPEHKPYNIGAFDAGGVSCLERIQFEHVNVAGFEAWSPPRFKEGPVVLWGAVPELFVSVDAYGVGPIGFGGEAALVAPDGPLLVSSAEGGLFWKGYIVIDDEVPPSLLRADSFAAVSLPGTAIELTADGEPCAVLADGRLYCWGYGSHGELGLGDDFASAEPALVAAPEPICEVDQGVDWMCARACSGATYCAGDNVLEQIVPGGAESIRTLTRIESLPALDALWLQGVTGCGLSSGELWCWGDRYLLSGGETGDPPTRMADFHDIVDVSLADASSLCVLRKDASVWCDGDSSAIGYCGNNAEGWQPFDFNCGAQ